MDINKLSKEDILGMSIDHTSQIPDVEPIIKIDNSYFATKGGLSMITGVTGSGKSSILRVMIASVLCGQNKPKHFDNLGIESQPANGKLVIYLNTEMSDSSTKKKIHDAVLNDLRLTKTPENFKVISLLRNTPEERRNYIKRIFEVLKDIHLLVIDGGADTVNSVNDEVISVAAIEELNRLANEHSTTIINVVHENKGNGQTRGHYGQHCERKATGIMSVKFDKAKKLFVASSGKIRETAQFEDFYFAFDEKGNLFQASAPTAAQRQNEAKTNDLLSLVIDGFKINERWKESEYKKWIAKQIKMSDKTGERRIKEMFEANYITTDGSGYLKCLVPLEGSPNHSTIPMGQIGQPYLSI